MHKLSQQSYIAGEWVSPEGEIFRAQDPVSHKYLDEYRNCQQDQVEQAMSAASQAWAECGAVSADTRHQFLVAIAEEIEVLSDQLFGVGDQETGLGVPRLTGELGRTVNQIRAFADIVKSRSWVQASIDTSDAKRAPAPKPDLRKMLKPIGPVAVFGASNFPFAFGALGGDTISAIAAGNPVIVKGHPSHPATNELMASAIDKAASKSGIHKGVFSLLQGDAKNLSIQLVSHPLIEAVGFTGSLSGGRAIMNAAAGRDKPIPVFAEMGSVNPVFLTNNALSERGDVITQNLANSVCLSAGQFCTSPGIVVVQKNSDFVDKLAAGVSKQARNIVLNEGIGSAFSNGISQFLDYDDVEWVNQAGADLDQPLCPPNIVLKTTAAAFLATAKLQHEVFGPATLVVECEDEAQLRQVAQALNGNLTATIHSTPEDAQLVKALLALLERKVGRVIFDGFPTGVEVCGSQHHGGPYPASSNGAFTSVGIDAIHRFARFVAYQDTPAYLLPPELEDSNPSNIVRRINGQFSFDAVQP